MSLTCKCPAFRFALYREGGEGRKGREVREGERGGRERGERERPYGVKIP